MGVRAARLATATLVACAACAPGPPSGVTTVTFWHGMESGVNNRILEEKIAAFGAAHPGIRIDAQVYGAADQLGPKLDAAVAGRTPPDLLWWAPAFFPKYAEAGVLREVDDFIAHDASFDANDVYPFLWDMSRYRGKRYVTPFSANNLAVYYNKRLFAEAGIERVPQTWDELRDAARRLTRGSVHGLEVPMGTAEWTVWTWQCFLWQAGGEVVDADGRPAFASEAGIAALDFWRSLLREGSASPSETDAGYKTDSFLAGRVAMTINGPWNYPLLREQRAVDVGAFPLPRRDRAATNVGGEALFLFRSTPARERSAWEFMKYVMSPAFQVDWAIASGYLPVSRSAGADARYRRFLDENPFLAVYNDQMDVGRSRPSLPQYPPLSAVLGKHIEAALYGKEEPKEALERAAAEAGRLYR